MFRVTMGCLLFVTISLFLLRQNYMMDIFTGVLTAHLVFRVVKKHEHRINKIASIF